MAINAQARRLQVMIYTASLIVIIATLIGIDVMIIQLWLIGSSNLNIIFVALASSFTILTDVITMIGIFQNIPLVQLNHLHLASRIFWIIIIIFAFSLFIYLPYITIKHYLNTSIPIDDPALIMNNLLGLGIALYNSGLALTTYIIYTIIRMRLLPDVYETMTNTLGLSKINTEPLMSGFNKKEKKDNDDSIEEI
ncbi:MAG: hypothetical protein ACP5NY_00325 [Thermocladium sp.]